MRAQGGSLPHVSGFADGQGEISFCWGWKNHLLKTFWAGPGGWSDRQDPDGTITWTSPTGQTYATRPGSRLLFPEWNTDTGPLPDHRSPPVSAAERGVLMPIRRRTRAAERLRRSPVSAFYNDARVAERNMPPPF